MTESVASELLEAAQKSGADAADVILVESADMSVSCRLGLQEELERSESSDVGLRVWVGDSQAIVSSTDWSSPALGELAERAVAMAKVATLDEHAKQAAKAQLATSWPELEVLDETAPTAEELLELALATESAAREVEGITNSEGADAYAGQYGVTLATSQGFMGAHKASSFSVSVSVLAGEGTEMERDYDYSSARHYTDLAAPEEIGRNAAHYALKRLNPRKVASGKMPVFFDPRVSRSLVSTFASAISGSSIARGTSFLKDAMGTEVFAAGVRIIDDPHIVRGLASRPFDGEGILSQKRALVDNGTLQSWLLDVRSASQLGLETTGHASRGVASPPSPSSTNLYMEAGAQSVEELLKEAGTGFYVTETFGMGVNTTTGDYSQGASGFWVENGEIAYPVSEVTIAGRLQDMFKNLTPASDLEMRYGTNAPTVRVDGMTLAGS